MSKTLIAPTIGRRLWYWPNAYDRHETGHDANIKHRPRVAQGDTSQPCDAGVVYVHGDRLVNLTVADHNGMLHARTSVRLLQEGDVPHDGEAYAEWMHYQVGRATAAKDAETASDTKEANGIAPERTWVPPSRRDELEASLVSGAANALANFPSNAKDIAAGIKTVLDTLRPLTPSTVAERCTRGPGSACSNCPTRPELVALPVRDVPQIAPIADQIMRCTGYEKPSSAGDEAPRVTLEDIEASIAAEHYFTASEAVGVEQSPRGPLDLLTFCVLVLKNGFTVTGESACVSPANFNADEGHKWARAAAIEKVWPLMGYALKDRLRGPSNDPQAEVA